MNESLLSGFIYVYPCESVVHKKLIETYGFYKNEPGLEEDISKRRVIINAPIVSHYTGTNIINRSIDVAYKFIRSGDIFEEVIEFWNQVCFSSKTMKCCEN
jgi:hypothetical protein